MTDFKLAYQLVAFASLIIGIANAIWLWIRAPTRALEKKLDEQTRSLERKLDEQYAKQDCRLDVHESKIQAVESDIRHLPTKEDFHRIANSMSRMDAEMSVQSKTLTRMDDYMRSGGVAR